MIRRKRNSAPILFHTWKRQNNPLPRCLFPKTRVSYIKQTGGASRSLERDPPMTARRDATPSILPPSQPNRLPFPSDFFGRINTFDESSRARRQTRRHGFNLRTDSNRFPRDTTGTRTHAFLYACTHTYANVSPPTGWRTPTHAMSEVSSSLARSPNPVTPPRPSTPFSPPPLTSRFTESCTVTPLELFPVRLPWIYIFFCFFFSLIRFFNFSISARLPGLWRLPLLLANARSTRRTLPIFLFDASYFLGRRPPSLPLDTLFPNDHRWLSSDVVALLTRPIWRFWKIWNRDLFRKQFAAQLSRYRYEIE